MSTDEANGAPDSAQLWSASLRGLMASDIRAWAKLWSPGRSKLRALNQIRQGRLIWNYCGLRATLLYRVSHELWRRRVPILPGIVGHLNLMLHGFDVPAYVEIGPGLYVPHPVGTVITAKRMGADITLISNITIGMRDTHDFPTIGDNVFIGAGARVLGGIVIGDGARIGANAVVLMDVPAGATAVGVPAKVKLPKA